MDSNWHCNKACMCINDSSYKWAVNVVKSANCYSPCISLSVHACTKGRHSVAYLKGWPCKPTAASSLSAQEEGSKKRASVHVDRCLIAEKVRQMSPKNGLKWIALFTWKKNFPEGHGRGTPPFTHSFLSAHLWPHNSCSNPTSSSLFQLTSKYATVYIGYILSMKH